MNREFKKGNCKEQKSDKRISRGSLTVETILFLIPFMCAFLTIVNVARFVQAEMLIHHAITQTAKQFSAYSYVLTKSQIAGRIQETHDKSEKFMTDVDNAVGSVEQFMDAVGNVGSTGNISGDIQNVVHSGANAQETLTNFFSDPKAIAEGIFSVAKAEGENTLLTAVVGALSKNSIKNTIALMSDDPDEFLTNVGVVGGMSGLDFSKSNWISVGSSEKANIQIVVTYEMKNSLFPDFDFGEHSFCQCASTLIW